MSSEISPEEQVTRGLLQFIKNSPTAFHAVSNIRSMLQAHGYTELSEGQHWQLKQGGRYFAVRNESSVIAFRIPEGAPACFMIAASHSDSPAFKIKANPEMTAENAYVRLNVEKYGGMLIAPWFDRPLSVAGRLIIRQGSAFRTCLVNVDRDLVMIPSVAIHMNRKANEGISYNVQTDVLPVFGDETCAGTFYDVIAEAAGVKKEEIAADDLFLYSRSAGTIWGANREYVSAGRLDDLQCTFSDLCGFIRSGEVSADRSSEPPCGNAGCSSESPCGNADCSSESPCGNEPAAASPASLPIPVLAVFDNEEVGSGTKQSADSTFLEDVLCRIASSLGLDDDAFRSRLSSSFMVSADNAHAVHPNAGSKADPVNRPVMNHGIVIKYNANQKYTTDAVSAALFRAICEYAGVRTQDFTNRSDIPGGSTLGNISNAHISLNTVDIGLPQLAMHSPYETAGVKDTADLIQAMTVFFRTSLSDEGNGNYRLVFRNGSAPRSGGRPLHPDRS